MYDEVYFGGEVLPCVVEKFPVIRKAQRKFTTYSVPGRNGDILIQQNAFENVVVPYQIYCGNGDIPADWNDLAIVLYKEGYQTLWDISDQDHFRLAMFNGPVDAQYYWEQVGRTTLEFNCRPERFLKSGAEIADIDPIVDMHGNKIFAIENPTAYTAKPLIVVYTTGGDGRITVNGEVFEIKDSPSNTINLDCEKQDAYLGTSNLNQYVSGVFPTFVPGTNNVICNLGISSVDVIPRWWEL